MKKSWPEDVSSNFVKGFISLFKVAKEITPKTRVFRYAVILVYGKRVSIRQTLFLSNAFE